MPNGEMLEKISQRERWSNQIRAELNIPSILPKRDGSDIMDGVKEIVLNRSHRLGSGFLEWYKSGVLLNLVDFHCVHSMIQDGQPRVHSCSSNDLISGISTYISTFVECLTRAMEVIPANADIFHGFVESIKDMGQSEPSKATTLIGELNKLLIDRYLVSSPISRRFTTMGQNSGMSVVNSEASPAEMMGSHGPEPTIVQQLVSMGFAEPDAQQAAVTNSNDLHAAAEWLLSRRPQH